MIILNNLNQTGFCNMPVTKGDTVMEKKPYLDDFAPGFRAAKREDLDKILDMTSRSFTDAHYYFPSIDIDDEARCKFFHDWSSCIAESCLEHGTIFVNDDMTAMMMVAPIEHMCHLPVEKLVENMRGYAGDAAAEMLRDNLNVTTAVENSVLPTENALWIELLAVDPAVQGQGVARSMMEEIRRQCVIHNLDMVQSTRMARNAAIYTHVGCDTLAEYHDYTKKYNLWLMTYRIANYTGD